MSTKLRFKVGDRVIVKECEYSKDAEIIGYEVEIKIIENTDESADYHYSVDLLGKTDKVGDTYALLADSEMEPVFK